MDAQQEIEKPFNPLNINLNPHPVIVKRALRYSKIPNYFVPNRTINFRNYFEPKTKKWWFHFNDVCFIIAKKTKPDVSRCLDNSHYKTFEIVQINDVHRVEVFVDTVGLFLLLNKATRDVREYYIEQILTLLIVPCMTSKRKGRKSTTELPGSE